MEGGPPACRHRRGVTVRPTVDRVPGPCRMDRD
jgi:hypothetical protein